MTKPSIIVPIYNVEKSIRPCLGSIFKQGLDDTVFEVIIVNDRSTDRSMEMIENIITHTITLPSSFQESQGYQNRINGNHCLSN